jgi:Holliday junction DNA helicase RuvA
MIALVQGEVALRRPDHVVVVCGGVGYRLAVSAHTLQRVPPVGQQTTLHAHLIARDDGLELYGFHSEAERELFLMLLGVQAVGPKVALAVLSGGAPRDLLAAIALGDTGRFQSVKGVGKRTAERIIVELREKVGAELELVARRRSPAEPGDPRTLARDGLLELGFQAAEAERLLASAQGDTAEELLTSALRGAAPSVEASR